MRFNPDIDAPKSPGRVLKETFLNPQQCTYKHFASLTGIRERSITDIVDGGLLSHTAIYKISEITRTAPRFWYCLQSKWQFYNYMQHRQSVDQIKPLIPKVEFNKEIRSPGFILEHRFVLPSRRSFNSLEKLIGLNAHTLNSLINGQNQITPLIAYRLAKSFDTSVTYWFSLQSGFEASMLLKANTYLNSKTIDSLSHYQSSVYDVVKKQYRETKKQIIHPGLFLLHKFLQPSGIPLRDWQHLFCISAKLFRSILNGKKRIPIELIIKICNVFQTDIGQWIHMQNRYYAWYAEKKFGKLARPPKRISLEPVSIDAKVQHPLHILTSDFLRPMRVTMWDFLQHIQFNPKRFSIGKRRMKKIDFELAIRVGQALGTGPHYWISLQLEYDIHHYKENRGARLLHLN